MCVDERGERGEGRETARVGVAAEDRWTGFRVRVLLRDPGEPFLNKKVKAGTNR